MNKSKTKMMMETDTLICVNNTQIENVESLIYLGQRYSARDKNHDKENKDESCSDGQHSPSTATSSRVTLEHD